MNEDDKSEYSAEWWVKEIAAADKELDKNWRDSADAIVKRFLDIRDDGDAISTLESSNSRKYNIFWANTQILKSALYATPPKPVVKRLHDDAKDDPARVGALILQRILSFGMMQDNSDMHRAFQNATEDRLIPGMGQTWLRLRTETEKYTIPPVTTSDGSVLVAATEAERITSQEVCTDYVHWRDFTWSPARIWSEVWWVSRRVWMTKKNFIKRFGEDVYKAVKADITASVTQEHGYPKGFEKGRISVREIWCKETEKAYWVQENTKMMLEEREDPLQLRDFFPCPQPLLATHTTNSLVPRPDYVMVQDQYHELDVVNDRISILTKALRVVGAYDSKNTALAQMITGSEFNMIPVDNWAMLSEQGGIKGVVDWFPVEVVAEVLDKLVNMRPLIIQQIYELTSISDIMRGSTNARETLGAQKLKAQYSSVRLRLTQTDVALFVANTMKIKCEIIAKHMDPEQIKAQSAIEFTESAGLADQGIKFIKKLDANQFRIEISEESLSMADYTAERELRIAYLTAVGQFLSQSAQMAESMPGSVPYIVKLIQWVTTSFRGSDDVETVLDEALSAAANAQPQQEQQAPDHSLEVAQIKATADTNIAQGTAQIKSKLDSERIQADLTKAQAEIASRERIALRELEVSRENNIRDNETRLRIANESVSADIHKAGVDAETKLKTSKVSTDEAADKKTGEDLKTILEPLIAHTETVAEAIKELAKPKTRRLVKDHTGTYSQEV